MTTTRTTTDRYHVESDWHARNLEDLFEEARNPSEDDTDREGRDTRDWTSMPTFGGEEPTDTCEIWSWDANDLLIGTCVDSLEIVSRAEHFAA